MQARVRQREEGVCKQGALPSKVIPAEGETEDQALLPPVGRGAAAELCRRARRYDRTVSLPIGWRGLQRATMLLPYEKIAIALAFATDLDAPSCR